MTHPARSPFLYGAIVAGLLLSACGKHADEQASAMPPAASTVASPPAAPGSTPAAARTAAIAPATSMTAATPASAGTTAAVSATGTATTGIKVEQLQLGDAVTSGYKISKPATTFAPSQNVIYASVTTSGSTPGSTLSARWSYLENEGQQISTISQTIATDGPATTTFKVRNPHDWPQGKYKVEISLDGKPVTAQTFEVKVADATASS